MEYLQLIGVLDTSLKLSCSTMSSTHLRLSTFLASGGVSRHMRGPALAPQISSSSPACSKEREGGRRERREEGRMEEREGDGREGERKKGREERSKIYIYTTLTNCAARDFGSI